ncbi:MAG: hypothetical protein PHW69_05070 [Elusimicrobiaceae bacterium]|nr:hypothetical protein [Elusimicrobiaceae bacterium]
MRESIFKKLLAALDGFLKAKASSGTCCCNSQIPGQDNCCSSNPEEKKEEKDAESDKDRKSAD